MRKKVNFLAIFAAAMLCAVIAIPTKSHNSIQQALTDTIGVTTVQAEDTDMHRAHGEHARGQLMPTEC